MYLIPSADAISLQVRAQLPVACWALGVLLCMLCYACAWCAGSLYNSMLLQPLCVPSLWHQTSMALGNAAVSAPGSKGHVGVCCCHLHVRRLPGFVACILLVFASAGAHLTTIGILLITTS